MKTDRLLNKLLRFNFAVSVWLSIFAAVSVINDPSLLIPDDVEAFGPLANNLKYAVVNIGIIQLLLWILFYSRNNKQIPLATGAFMALIAFELVFYGDVNTIAVPRELVAGALYIGLSHILYGLTSVAETAEKADGHHG